MKTLNKTAISSGAQIKLPFLWVHNPVNSSLFILHEPEITARLVCRSFPQQQVPQPGRYLYYSGYNNGNEWERSHTPALPPAQPAVYPHHRLLPGSHDNDDDNNHEPVNMEGVDCTGAVAQSS